MTTDQFCALEYLVVFAAGLLHPLVFGVVAFRQAEKYLNDLWENTLWLNPYVWAFSHVFYLALLLAMDAAVGIIYIVVLNFIPTPGYDLDLPLWWGAAYGAVATFGGWLLAALCWAVRLVLFYFSFPKEIRRNI